jgi:hypothetical protein
MYAVTYGHQPRADYLVVSAPRESVASMEEVLVAWSAG